MLGTVLDEMLEWLYGQIVGFLGNFFAQMGAMGAELFDMPWVQSIVLFFSYLGWSLYGTGLVVSAFECGISYQSGRGANIQTRALAAIKGFLAVSLFTKVPIELFKLSVELQASLTAGITGAGTGIDTVAGNIMERFQETGSLADAVNANIFGGIGLMNGKIGISERGKVRTRSRSRGDEASAGKALLYNLLLSD